MKKMYVALMAFMFLLSGVFASFSVSSVTVSPTQASPGQFGTITFVITNADTLNSVQGVTMEVRKSDYITMTNQLVIGDLGPGSTTTLSVPFRVEQNTPTGIYTIDITVYGLSKIPSGTGTQSESKKIASTVKVIVPPALQFSLDNNHLTEISSTNLIIRNDGGIAKKVYISIANSDIGLLNQDVIYVDQLGKNATIPIGIDARNAQEGSQKLQLKITYEDELGNSYNTSRDLSISIKKESGDFVFTQESSIVTGKESKVKVRIKNEGDDAQDIRLSIASSNIQLVGVSELQIGNLKRGESAIVEVPLLANVEPGTTSANFDLKWVENGQSREGTKSVPIKVSSDADVGVYFEAKPTPLYPNSEYTISVTVSNLGSYPIEATTTTFSSDAFELLSIQPEQYIGGLSKDDFSSVQYKVRTKDIAPGTYPLSIKVKYRDASGEWVEKTKSINVSVLPQPAQKNGSIETIVITIVVVLALVYWFVLRPKKTATKK